MRATKDRLSIRLAKMNVDYLSFSELSEGGTRPTCSERETSIELTINTSR